MRGFTDETVTEWMLVKAAISANFDSNRALNHIMDGKCFMFGLGGFDYVVCRLLFVFVL